MKKYDYVLLEPLYWNRSHGTFDIDNLINILTAGGKKVAVINFLNDDTYYQNKPYDVINIYPTHKFPNRETVQNIPNKFLRFFNKIFIILYPLKQLSSRIGY